MVSGFGWVVYRKSSCFDTVREEVAVFSINSVSRYSKEAGEEFSSDHSFEWFEGCSYVSDNALDVLSFIF